MDYVKVSRCKVCNHPDREALDRGLDAGESQLDLARRHRLSTSSVHRHLRHREKSRRRLQQLLEQTQARAQRRRLVETQTGLLRLHRRSLHDADKAHLAVQSAREIAHLARTLTGLDLDAPAAAQPPTLFAADYRNLAQVILSALESFPDALLKVSEALDVAYPHD